MRIEAGQPHVDTDLQACHEHTHVLQTSIFNALEVLQHSPASFTSMTHHSICKQMLTKRRCVCVCVNIDPYTLPYDTPGMLAGQFFHTSWITIRIRIGRIEFEGMLPERAAARSGNISIFSKHSK